MKKCFCLLFLSGFLSLAQATVCPNLSDPLPLGWHCFGHTCPNGTFSYASFAGYENFGSMSCFYTNNGNTYSVYAHISGGVRGDNWMANAVGKKCFDGRQTCEFGEVFTE